LDEKSGFIADGTASCSIPLKKVRVRVYPYTNFNEAPAVQNKVLSLNLVFGYNPPMFPVVENGVAEGIGHMNLIMAQHLFINVNLKGHNQ
jgi:hypothetical protein